MPKNNLQILALDQKFLKAKNTIIRAFNQLPKSVGSFLAVDQKFKITQNDINKTFDQLKTCEIIRSNDKICLSSLLKLLIK